MELRLLGPVELEGPHGPVVVGGPKERALLAFLALRANQAVSDDVLIDALWADEPPRTAIRTLQSYLSRLRRVLAEAEAEAKGDGVDASLAIESGRGGWTLRVGEGVLDLARVEALLVSAREAATAGDRLGAALTLGEAQRSWRGHALAEFGDASWAVTAAGRLEELRLHVIEERIDAELACGRHDALAGELESLSEAHPLRERVWGQRILALYRAGRQAEALRVYQRLRETLAEELGIDPSPTLARLEQRILQQDASLDWHDELARTRPGEVGVMTVLFADVAAESGPRSGQLDVLRDTVADGAAGAAVRSLDDGVVAVFASTLDALRSAVAIQRAVRRRGSAIEDAGLPVRVGLHAGELDGDDDEAVRAIAAVASTLCRDAGVGQILVSRVVSELAGSHAGFEFEERGPVAVKDVDEPVVGSLLRWEDVPVRPLPVAFASLHEHAFVGRADELSELAAAWDRAQAGALEVMLLSGEPGIGKTALAVQQAVSAWADGAVVLFGRCDEESLIPFQPFVEALGQYVETTAPTVLRSQLGADVADLALLLPELRRRLPEVADVSPTGAESERYRVFEAVPALLRAIGHEAPVVLVLDDLHWADRPTLQLLQHVIRRAPGSGVLVLGTYRDTDLVRTHPLAEALAEMRRANLVVRIHVRGLTRSDVITLVTSRATVEPADEALADALFAETEGSPLFLREILRHLAETGTLVRTSDGRWEAQRRIDQLGIPEGVREVIGRRLTRLSADANAALRTGSMLGHQIRLDVLEAVTDLPPDGLLEAMEEATSAGIVDEVPGAVGRWSFTHALVRQALYDELSLTRRVRMHQRIGEAIEAIEGAGEGPHLAELAFHFSQAAVAGQAGKAIDYARRAGDFSRSLVAYEDAARHYATALEVAEDVGGELTLRADLLLATGECHWLAAGPGPARATFEAVVDLLNGHDPERLAKAALGYAGASVRAFWVDIGLVNERAIALLEEAIASLDAVDSVLRARLLACLAQELYFLRGSDGRRFELAAEAVAMARRLDDPATLAFALCASNLAKWGPDNLDGQQANGVEAAAIGRALGDQRLEGHSVVQQVSALVAVGDIARARQVSDRAAQLLEPMKDPAWAIVGPAFQGGWALMEGCLDDAEALFREAFQVGQHSHDPAAFSAIFGLGVLRFYQGRAGEMAGVASEALDIYPDMRGFMLVMAGACHAEIGLDDVARTYLDKLDPTDKDDLRRNFVWLFATQLLARACWRMGDSPRAATVHDLLLPHADQVGSGANINMGCVRLSLACCATLLGRLDEAEANFEAAVAAHTRTAWRPALVETQLWFARMLAERSAQDDHERAVGLLDQAAAGATEIGMPGHGREAAELRDRLLGLAGRDDRSRPLVTRRDRARSKLLIRGRAAVARWTKGDSDEELVRRFGADRAQRVLFSAMTLAYQPAMAQGFEGDMSFELRPPDDELDPAAADWWTIEVRGRKATARRGRSESAVVTLHVGLADFIRFSSGELSAGRAMMDGKVDVDGDVLLAIRLPDLFGAVEPLEEIARGGDA